MPTPAEHPAGLFGGVTEPLVGFTEIAKVRPQVSGSVPVRSNVTGTPCFVAWLLGLATGGGPLATVWVITNCGGFEPASFELKIALFELALVRPIETGTLPVIIAGSRLISL